MSQEFQTIENDDNPNISQWAALEWIERHLPSRVDADPHAFRNHTSSEIEAMNRYRRMMVTGAIVAIGKAPGTESYYEIPKTFWENAIIDRHDAYEPMPGTTDFINKHTGWRSIRLSKDRTLEMWPAERERDVARRAARPSPQSVDDREFVKNFIDQEQTAGRDPKQDAMEAAAKAAGISGGRDDRRSLFNEIMAESGSPVRTGRPTNKLANK